MEGLAGELWETPTKLKTEKYDEAVEAFDKLNGQHQQLRLNYDRLKLFSDKLKIAKQLMDEPFIKKFEVAITETKARQEPATELK